MQDQNTGNGKTSGRSQMSTGGSAAFGMAVATVAAVVLFIAPGPLSHHHQSTTTTTNSASQK